MSEVFYGSSHNVWWIVMKLPMHVGASIGHLWVKKKFDLLCQVTELWRHKRYSLRPDFHIFLFALRTVSLDGGFELNRSFGVYVTVTDIPIICSCQVTDSWRHTFDLCHRGDMALSVGHIHRKYSTEMHQNSISYAELRGNTIAKVSCRYDK